MVVRRFKACVLDVATGEETKETVVLCETSGLTIKSLAGESALKTTWHVENTGDSVTPGQGSEAIFGVPMFFLNADENLGYGIFQQLTGPAGTDY